MTIEFQCKVCDKVLRTTDDKAGVQSTCPGCGTSVIIPRPDELEAFDELEEAAESVDDSVDDDADIPILGPDKRTKTCPMCGEQVRATARQCPFCGEDYRQGGDNVTQTRPLVYGRIGARFAAAFVDGIVTNIISFVVGAGLGVVVAMGGGPDGAIWIQENSDFVGGFLGVGVSWLYEALLESSSAQATLGKRLCNLKVTGLDGKRISFGRATGRHFGKFLSAMILLIGYLMAFSDPRKQALHDKMAGTLVVCR